MFAQKAACPHCGAMVKEPKAGASAHCPTCGRPGPWASLEEQAAYERQEAARRAAAEAAQREAEGRRLAQLHGALELTPAEAPGFVAQGAEDVYLAVPARLFEWKKERGHYEGGQGFRGVSVRVPGTKAMRAYYGGLSQRRFVQGEENWKQTAEGTAVVTSKRIVFRGPTKNVEWAFAKLVGLDVDPDSSAMVLQVTNRQASHVLNVDDLEVFTLKVEAALAKFQGRPSPSLDESTPAPLPGSPPSRPDL